MSVPPIGSMAPGGICCPAEGRDLLQHERKDRDMSKKALIVVDIQNDYFPNGKWPLAGAEAAADNAARIIAAARTAGDLVVYIRHEFTVENPPFFKVGSEGAQIHPKVLNRPGEHVVVKNHVNSFRETD